MTEAEELVRAWFEKFWNGRSPAVAKKYADENSVFHSVDATGGSVKGVSDFLKFHKQLLGAFPDLKFRIEKIVVTGDTAALRWTAKATHEGIWMDRAPTKKTLNFSGMGFVKVRNGKVVEAWDEWDRFGALVQIDNASSTSRR